MELEQTGLELESKGLKVRTEMGIKKGKLKS